VELTAISVTIGVVIALACACYCRRLALEKGHNVVLWTLLGLVLTVIALPVLVLLPPAHGAAGEAPRGDVDDASPTSVERASRLDGPV
jgi:hypothetical protein